ncbi:serine threonine- phosphatase 6 regulatory ankyrin repeat subunit a [Fusarium longipes]|uniref:Serine threonine-phosphatase 6 regulatory ankyrin repeat subunit a n=1 Tax=Fusarium longipes TaxID=694270 RepID=A0A395T0N3_9HYPO|nr:serine threonine- phosphatase 6 regulatory ankyrin repeat subunit a [Fusarium longipes]
MRTITSFHLPLSLLLLFVAQTLAEDEDTDFLMNVFSDLGPVLALFGEQFARQFLSETFTAWDHIIFACVPLGIMTAIAGAIRVDGRGVLKAFIGRARENRAAAEIEYMSSTSAEVGELFNGKGIVRTMGQSKIAQFIIFPQSFRSHKKELRKTLGIHTLQSAADEDVLRKEVYHDELDMRIRKMFKFRSDSRQEEPEDGASGKGGTPKYWESLRYPNLQLNIAAKRITAMQRSIELHLAAFLAVLLQASLLAIAAVIPYQVEGFDQQPWGLPCYIGGSVLLFFGMLACSVAIERSTKEYKWFPTDLTTAAGTSNESEHSLSLFWVQGKQRVSDQEFDSYIIYAQNKDFVSTSSRKEDIKSKDKPDQNESSPGQENLGISKQTSLQYSDIRALTALLAGGAGFTIQFIGLRGLPWPVAVAHLGAIIIMAIIRALIRRRLGEDAQYYRVPSEHELDFLAAQLVETKCQTFQSLKKNPRPLHKVLSWRVDTAKHNNGTIYSFDFLGTNEFDEGNENRQNQHKRRLDRGVLNMEAQKVIAVRKRLGDLCEWETRAFKSALALVRSIERFLDEFMPGSIRGYRISWRIPLRKYRDKVGSVELKIIKGDTGWKINAGEVEAILSLWMSNLEADKMEQESDGKHTEWQRRKAGVALGVDYCRILGRKYDNGVLQRDLNWWVGNPAISEIGTERNQEVAGPRSGPDDGKITIGYTGTTNALESSTLLVQHSTAGLSTIAAQHLFTHFIWVVVDGYLPKDFLDQGSISINESVSIQPAKQLDFFRSKPGTGRRLRHNKLTQLALHGEKEGLGVQSDILLCLIPVLSIKDCLPNDATLQLDLPKLSDQRNWSKVIPRYTGLLKFVENSIGRDFEDYLGLAVVVYALDLAYLMILDNENMGYGKSSQPDITPGQRTDSRHSDQSERSDDSEQSQHQESSEDSEGSEYSDDLENLERSVVSRTSEYQHTKLKRYALQESDDSRELLTHLSKSFPKVIEKLSKFYMLQGRGDFLSKLECMHSQVAENIWSEPGGMAGFMKQIWSELGGMTGFVKKIWFTKAHYDSHDTHKIELRTLQGKDLERRDIFGWTVLHYAAACPYGTIPEDQENNTPDDQKPSLIDTLKRNRPGRWWLDNFGRSPVHVASLTGNVQFLNILLASLQDDDVQSALESKGRDGMTPVHLAIRGGHKNCIQVMMQQPCFSRVEIKEDAWQRSPVHLAIAQGQYECCKALINDKRLQFNPNTLDALGKSIFSYLNENDQKQKEVGAILLKKHSKRFDNTDREGKSVWHHAIRFLSPPSIRILRADHGSTINSSNNEKLTPLHLAVLLNNDKMVQRLLHLGATPSINLAKDKSPLMLACNHGRTRMVYDMLEKEEQAAKDQDVERKTALHYAVESKDCKDSDREMIVRRLVKAMKSEKVDVGDQDSLTPLHIACINSNTSAASILLDSNADPTAQDKNGRNALHHAILAWQQDGEKVTESMKKITKKLLEKTPTCMNAPDNDDDTPLTRVCKEGRPLDFISLVVELSNQGNSKLDPNQGDGDYDEPPLSWACEYGHTEIVRILLSAKNLNLNKRAGYRAFTPLHFALMSQSLEIIQLLISDERFELDSSAVDKDEPNFAEFALSRYKECLTVLLLHEKTRLAIFSTTGWEQIFRKYSGSDVIVWDAIERAICEDKNAVKFPVHSLAQLGRSDKIQSLRVSGKNVCELDQDGWTPADIAGRYGHKNLEAFLRPHEPTRDIDTSPYREPSTFISLFDRPKIVQSKRSSHDGCLDNILVEILHPLQKRNTCALGFCQSYVPESHLPGWHEGSFAYHGDDGKLFVSQNYGTRQSTDETFEEGDIVGCGLNLETGQGYRTKNGVLLGSSPEFQHRKFSTGKFYPCIGTRTFASGDEFQVRVNLRSSPEYPFCYKGPYNGLLLRDQWQESTE